MIVHEEDWVAYTYQEASKTVLSLNKLPVNIQKEVKTLIDESFWEFKDSIHFVNAQIVNITSFLKDARLHNKQEPVPKYELNFYWKDESIGVIRYNITLHLDDYGQILKINWPMNGAGIKKTFLPRDLIKDFALKEAKRRHYNLDKYLVNFEYNEQFDRFCWEFSFLERELVGAAEYNFIKVPWDELFVIDSTEYNN
ncbi:hypothetical protein [Pedobacter heparinus]|uniref:hypothetical protein n=1 Tax=Pedobacter heparinus TaxID=984 RepID=UPI00292D9329|nr:hypothetical protein [Pedobacter heparinus]